MSKLIVEMWMPTRCPCVLAVDNNGWFSPCFAEHGIPSRTKDFDNCIEKGTRPDWCPICGELPDEHGDLIDRDALRKYGMEYRGCIDEDGLIYIPLRDVTKSISNAPTVIEAERKDDDKQRSNIYS